MYNINDIFYQRDDLLSYIDANNEKFNSVNEHSLRVSELAVKLATAVELSIEDINQVLIGSFLHDIGKIFLGNEILEGNMPLTKKQRDEVISHSILGHGYLKDVSGLDKAKEIVLLHHERIDGTGYPNGLVGSEIPVHVKIVSICDSYDAMTSYRSYKLRSFTQEEAIEELIINKNLQFDSNLVDIFIKQLENNNVTN